VTAATESRRLRVQELLDFVGVSYRQLDHAARRGLFRPWGMGADELETGSGFRRDWTDDAVIAAWAAAQVQSLTGWPYTDALDRLSSATMVNGRVLVWQYTDDTGGEIILRIPVWDAMIRLAALRATH
jgi:hypothetical protein